jgi:hypothetical protein
MGQALEHRSRLAICFENAADDETLPLHQRAEFARKANWLRVIARLAAKEPAQCQEIAPELTALAKSLPTDARLSSFKVDLLCATMIVMTSGAASKHQPRSRARSRACDAYDPSIERVSERLLWSPLAFLD